MRHTLLSWPLQVALSVALVAWLVSGLDWSGVAATLRGADTLLVAGALAALAPIPLLAAERWRTTCAAVGIALARRFFVPATYAAQFAGQFLPSGIGVDAVRLALLWRQRVRLPGGIQSLALDRICGVAGLLVLVYAGLPFALERLPAGAGTPIAAATGVLVVGCAALLFVDRWPLPTALRRGWAGRTLALVADLRLAIGTPRMAAALAIAVALHVLAIVGIWLLARAFGYDLQLRDLASVTAAAILVSMLPVSFNGWGVREGAMMLGLSLLAVPREVAIMISLLYGIGGALCSLPGSVSWYRLVRGRRDAP